MSDALQITATEVTATFYGCRDRMRQRSMSWLRRNGVSISAMCEPDPIGAANIVQVGGYFDFCCVAEGGSSAFIFLARDDLGQAADIVAWQPGSDRVLAWLDAVAVLGEDDVHQPMLEFDGHLPVWRSPLGWLSHGRRGVVIVNPVKASYRLEGRTLVAEDDAHRALLRGMLQRTPNILVAKYRREAV